jgi:hypothetical protein
MPDLSMCLNKGCPLKYKCYRFMANPDQWQSYTLFSFDRKGCEYFLKIEK